MPSARQDEQASPASRPPRKKQRGKSATSYLAKAALLGSFALALIVVLLFFSVRKPSDCLRLEAKYLGEVSVNCSTSQVSTTEVPDAKPQLVYTNARTGFSLEMGDPDNWSVIPAREDEHGGKILTFPPGIVTSIPLSVLTDDAAVAFVCTQNVGSGRPSLWVFRVSQNFGTVEAFVAAETGRLLRTGTAASIFWASKYIPYGDKGEPNPYTGNGKDVTLSKIEVSPDHRSALLLWKSPYTGDDFDVVARALIEANDAYYVVAIMGEANNPTEIRINNELRKMLETFKAL